MSLDDLVAEPDPAYRLPSEDSDQGGSNVAEIDKAELIELLEEEEGRSPLSINELEHSEDVSA